MRYRRGSVDYSVNLESLREMEEVVPMTLHERDCLKNWVKGGHDIDSNPWHYFESDHREMNYLKARRILFGASHGTWDTWEYASPWVVVAETKDFFDK